MRMEINIIIIIPFLQYLLVFMIGTQGVIVLLSPIRIGRASRAELFKIKLNKTSSGANDVYALTLKRFMPLSIYVNHPLVIFARNNIN